MKRKTHTYTRSTLTRRRAQRIKVLSTPRQAEPRFVPISDVTCSSGTSWQMWKISHYRGCRKPGEAFDLITSSYTNVFNVLFHFLKTHICFIYFQTKKIQPNNNNSKSTPIPSPSWEVPPRSPEYCSRLRPYFSMILTGLVWLISYVVLWLSRGVV